MGRSTFLIVAAGALVGLAIGVAFLWKPGSPPERAQDDLRRRLDQLRSVPYTSVTDDEVDESVAGVVSYKRERTYDGYNIYCSETVPEVYLMDMSGKVVHMWTYPQDEFHMWEHAIMLAGGDLVVIEQYTNLLRLDWNSNLVWRWNAPGHHDVVMLDDGTYYAIWLALRSHRGFVVRFPSLVHLAADGEEIDRWSAYDHLEEIKQAFDTRSFFDTILDSLVAQGYSLDSIRTVPGPVKLRKHKHGRKMYDYFHMNTISILPDTPLGQKDRRFRPGNIMICFRHVNQIATLDRETKEVLWAWGEGHLEWPHHPTMLADGNILIYDNGILRKYTRVVELNPLTETIEWEYMGSPPESFYSRQKGSAQRLPNGNTLICDSESGRAIEVTRGGEIVWEWLNPSMHEGHREQVYRMMRLDPATVEPLLGRSE